MAISEIQQSTTAAAPTTAPATSRPTAGDSSLGRDAFLKIFLTQLQQQDPLAPQDATQMSAQLAQFSQLEQSLQMTEQLVGIREAIGELVSKSGAGGNRGAEAIALLGHSVDVDGDSVEVATDGTFAGLRSDVSGAAQQIVVTIADRNGNPLAAGELRAGRGGAPAVLASGEWELAGDAAGTRLRAPGGAEYALPLVTLVRGTDGKLSPAQDASGAAVPFALGPGSYRARAAALSTAGEELEVKTTTSGVVRAVRELGSDPLLLVNQNEIALSSVIRVR